MKKRKKAIIFMLIINIFFSLSYISAQAQEQSAAQRLNILGILQGDGGGVTEAYLSKPATRISSAILLLKLKRAIADAEAYTGAENFLDSDLALSVYSRTIMGFLKANPVYGFIGYQNRFDPNSPVTDQMFYKVLLSLLGYEQDVDFAWSETLIMADLAGMDAIAGKGELTVNDLAVAIVEALDSEIKDTGILLIEQFVIDGVLSIEDVHEAGWEYIVVN